MRGAKGQVAVPESGMAEGQEPFSAPLLNKLVKSAVDNILHCLQTGQSWYASSSLPVTETPQSNQDLCERFPASETAKTEKLPGKAVRRQAPRSPSRVVCGVVERAW